MENKKNKKVQKPQKIEINFRDYQVKINPNFPKNSLLNKIIKEGENLKLDINLSDKDFNKDFTKLLKNWSNTELELEIKKVNPKGEVKIDKEVVIKINEIPEKKK